MNFVQLEYLRELHIRGSFSKAAQILGVTQPALTLQIQKLEEELDFKLLDRSKRPFKFTVEGETFYLKAVEILKMVDQLKQISIEISEEVKGQIIVGIIPTLAPYLVPLFINELNRCYPKLQVEVVELKTEEIISRLKLGNIDCGILSTPITTGNIAITPLFYERFYTYISENHELYKQDSVDIHEINDSDIWYLEEGNCFQNQVNSICKINIQKKTSQNLVYKSSSIESLRRIVENKNGITFIPELATLNIPSELEEMVKEISGEQPVREISLVTPRNYSKERQVEALKNVILKSIPKRMQERPDSWIVDTELDIN
ncbi:MAG: hydrogen peroxide-inducible genes activator [Draconibacterium sp.]